MATTPATTGTTGTPEPEGVVSGAILRLLRTQLRLSQERAAELLGVDPNTVKSWETGRRPLGRVSVHKLRRLMRTLSRLGADRTLVDQLDTAIDVDHVIAEILTSPDTPHGHPLGTWVHTRAWHDLLAWAVAGTVPAALRGHNGAIPRPRLAVPQRQLMFQRLRVAAEKAGDSTDAEATLLRRQVYFVASWDDSGDGRDWLARMERRDLRRLRVGEGWTPLWVAGRSLAVARACQGDPDQLRHFIAAQLANDQQEAANLNYWAYWIGENDRPAISDEFMAAGDLGPWRGIGLLRHLVAGLSPTVPYVELTIHSVRALIERRPWLLDDDPGLTADLHSRATRLLDEPGRLSEQARRELDRITFATRMRGQR